RCAPGLMEMYTRTSPLTNDIRVISLRATGLLRQSCCSHCLYQEDYHVCLEQTPCRSLVGIICTHGGNIFLRYSTGQYEWPQDPYNPLDGPELSRFGDMGLRLDDRSNPRARKECVGVACPLLPRSPSDVNVVRIVPPAPDPVVIHRLSWPWPAPHDRLLDPTALGEPTPAK